MRSSVNSYAFARTKGRQNTGIWFATRAGRMTSSNFRRIATASTQGAIDNVISQILEPKQAAIETLPRAMRVGLAEEKNAIAAYVSKYNRFGTPVTVAESGVVIDNNHPWLATSPDGIVTDQEGNQWLVEVKCIYDTKPIPRTILDVARERGSRFYCKVGEGGEFTLRKSHPYFSQCQGQLALTGFKKLDLAIYAPRTGEIVIVGMDFDAEEWEGLFAKLKAFKERHFTCKLDTQPQATYIC